MANCQFCHREMDNPVDLTTADRGDTTCLRCWAEVTEEPDAIKAMAALAAPAAPENPSLLCVAVYLEDRQYGGPEEGGWYYDAGELVTRADFYLELGAGPMVYENEHGAEGYSVLLQKKLDAGPNQGRRSTSSVLSTGRYVARVEDFPPPLHYPAERQIYE